MPELNVSIPHQEVTVLPEFLYDGNPPADANPVPGIWHAVSSIRGQALGCHVLLENGASIWRLPLHALVEGAVGDIEKPYPLDVLQLWDCPSPFVTATVFDWLGDLRASVKLKGNDIAGGRCLFTLDWYGSPQADSPGDSGHKCGHVILLDCGQFCCQPNNRVQFFEPACAARPFSWGDPPKYKTNTRLWRVEVGDRWVTSGAGEMFYGVQRAEPIADVVKRRREDAARALAGEAEKLHDEVWARGERPHCPDCDAPLWSNGKCPHCDPLSRCWYCGSNRKSLRVVEHRSGGDKIAICSESKCYALWRGGHYGVHRIDLPTLLDDDDGGQRVGGAVEVE